MAQFDVFRLPDGALVVDCQADLLSDLSTRLVVPLQAMADGGQVSARLNPVLTIGDESLVLDALCRRGRRPAVTSAGHIACD